MNLPSARISLIYNPNAGKLQAKAVAANVAAFWRKFGWEVSLQPTAHAGHAVELARSAADSGCGLVLVMGGDGTISDVANGLVHTETVLAMLPSGTANSFAKELGIVASGPTVAQLLDISTTLMNGVVQRMDTMQCDDGRHWLLWAGIGVDGDIVNRVEPRSPFFKRLGLPGYVVEASPHLLNFSGVKARVTVDDRTFEGDYVLINASNCRLFVGGKLHLNRDGVLDDGLIEVWLFQGSGLLTLAQHALFIALEQHHGADGVQYLRGHSVTVETFPPSPYQLDGEPVGVTPLACHVERLALRVLTPNTETARRLFSLPGEPLF